MRVPATADALRVARALLMLSQREAADGANVVQRSVSAAETSKSVLLETNLSLVDFYSSRGIMMLGEGIVGKEVTRSGARWDGPDGPRPAEALATFHSEDVGISFRAARALLNKKQSEVAAATGLTLDVVKGLESGTRSAEPYRMVIEWYECQGVEFTGWGDVSSGKFFSVGVRWAPSASVG